MRAPRLLSRLTTLPLDTDAAMHAAAVTVRLRPTVVRFDPSLARPTGDAANRRTTRRPDLLVKS
jgi:hypothetical protein